MMDAKPPRWADLALRLLLPARDRDSVTGDLLEEYREGILPTRGRVRAHLWYLRQMLTLVDGMRFGLILGAALGAWILVDTAIDPLADDTPFAVGGMFAGVFLLLGVPAFWVRRRGGRFGDAVRTGAVAGVMTFAQFHWLGILRVNLFLDTIRHRSDWQGLILRFGQSGVESLRVYANYVYLSQVLLIVAMGTGAGAISGLLSGLVADTLAKLAGPVRRTGA